VVTNLKFLLAGSGKSTGNWKKEDVTVYGWKYLKCPVSGKKVKAVVVKFND
jgi:hypothetical protein